jgi:hypothetical protein
MRDYMTCLLIVCAVAVPRVGLGTPIQWSGNDHWYEAVHVSGGITWCDASAAAQAAGGHLATATLDAENAFIFDLVDDPQFWYLGIPPGAYSFGPWLGGYQFDNGAEPDGHWRWVTDDPWTFTNWATGEPNNDGGDEDRLHLFTNTDVGTLTPGSTWNDAPGGIQLLGYVIEWPAFPTGIAWPGSATDWRPCTWSRIRSLYR